MSDLRIIQMPCLEGAGFDLSLLENGCFDESQELASAVIIALATDRRANKDDTLPGLSDDNDRRGWWGDNQAEEIWDGWPIGSRLWLLKREKITGRNSKQGSTIARVEMYANEALTPFITHKIVSRIDVRAFQQQREVIGLNIKLWRDTKIFIELRFDKIWQEIGE